MPHDRFFHDAPFVLHESLTLEEEEFHHLKVMRIKEGETIEIVNGKGFLAITKVEKIGKNQAALFIQELSFEEPPPFKIILAQGLPRMNRLETVLEKGCELGMDELWLFPGRLSEKKEVSTSQMERMNHLLISSLKQCGRLWLPSIKWMPPLAKWEPLPLPSFFGDVNSTAPSLFQKWKGKEGIIFFVGPEKGFDEEEIEKLKELKSEGVKLAPHILRTDTASLAALTLLAHLSRCL